MCISYAASNNTKYSTILLKFETVAFFKSLTKFNTVCLIQCPINLPTLSLFLNEFHKMDFCDQDL